ncbi:MAG TPA: hypothetical protein VMC08_08490 [Bacteroidales bacterium]|nr:hypothetical protein [Bacteroidales bacterium]
MKTLKSFALLAILGLALTVPSMAQNPVNSSARNSSNASRNYVDKNGNGICDNFENGLRGGRSSNFVDKNGDGICDHRQYGGVAPGMKGCCGNGYQRHYGRGKGYACGLGYQHRQGRR